MKLTEAKLKELIKEAMEEEREFDFSGMISKDIDYAGLRTVIELLLDGEDIKYDVKEKEQKFATGHVSKQATYTFEKPEDADFLIDALKAAGLPDEDKTGAFVRLTNPSYSIGRGRNIRKITIYDNS